MVDFLKVACTVFYNVVLCGFCPPYIDIFDVEDGSELEVWQIQLPLWQYCSFVVVFFFFSFFGTENIF